MCKSKYTVNVVCTYPDTRAVTASWPTFEFGNSCTGWSEGTAELLGVQGCPLTTGPGYVPVKSGGGILSSYFLFIVEFQWFFIALSVLQKTSGTMNTWTYD